MMNILADALLIATGQTPIKRTDVYHADRDAHRSNPRAEKPVK